MKKIDIVDEENSVVIDGSFDTTEYTIHPDRKIVEVNRSIKGDCFYTKQVIEYKISINPIEIHIRTLESSHEPPLEYSIKDGVVLESELKKGGVTRVADLNKEVEWNKVPLLGNYEVNLYILSKHPEIITKEDYRRFIRQSIERIKTGMYKIEDIIKNDSSGLQIHNNEHGKSIWYKIDDTNEREKDEYVNTTDEKRGETKYGKKISYVEKIKKTLFSEDSTKYVGISEYEFNISEALLVYLESLLNKRTVLTSEGKSNIDQNNNVKKIFKYIPSIIFTLIEVGVVVSVIDNAYYSDYSEVIAGLVILFALIRSSTIGFDMKIGFMTVGLAKDILDIKKKTCADGNIFEETEKLKEASQNVFESRIKIWIRGVGLFIIYLFGLALLLGFY